MLIIRRGIIIICAAFCFLGLISCSVTAASENGNSDIFAQDVTVDYDGKAHTIFVLNTLTTDTILYSTDNALFSHVAPSFVNVGVYTVYFKVIRSGSADFSSSATVTILPIVLSGISAENVSVVYDGMPHTISVLGTLDDDVITFSSDGVTFSEDIPAFTEIGEHEVFYRVERPYGNYSSSCLVTIYPMVYGRYLNPTYGVVVLSEDNVVFDGVSGAGFIGDKRFSVADSILRYDGLSFTLLSDSDCVYRLIVEDSTVYFVAQSSGKLDISFSDGAAEISQCDDSLLSVPDCNYCESGDVVDYIDLCFEQAFIHSDDITDIEVTLTFREENPVTVGCVYVIYDGLPHSIDLPENAVFLSAETEFTDVGRHTVKAVFLSEIYLPYVLDLSLVILPNIDGMYISSDHFIHISGGLLSFDGEEQQELSILGDDWAYNDLPITVTDDGIIYDGAAYAKTTDTVIVVRVRDKSYVVTVSPSIDQIVCVYSGTELNFTADDVFMLSIPLSADSIDVLIDGEPLISLFGEGSFIIGRADICSSVIFMDIVCH